MTINPIDPDITKVQPGDDRQMLDSFDADQFRAFDLATPDTAPDEWKRAAARRVSANMGKRADGSAMGVPDPDGRLWNDKPFATGGEYLDFMRDIFDNGGDIWERAATPELKEFAAADAAGRLALARAAQGRLEKTENAAGRLVQRYGLPDNARELADAPDDVRSANARLRDDLRRRADVNYGFAPGPRESAPPRPDAETAADRAALDAWRRQREETELVEAHQAKLYDKNLALLWLGVAPSLSDTGREIAEQAFKQRRLADRDIARFQRLDEKEQAVIAKLARLARDPTAGTFWNTLGDAGVGFINGVISLPVNAVKQIDTLTTTVDQVWFGKDAGLVDNAEMNRRARTEQRLREALDDPAGINPSGAEHGYLARSLIGAVSTLPYMGYASMGIPGFTSVALDFMERLDERIAQEGGDVHGRGAGWAAQKAVYGGLYAGIEKVSALPVFKETSDIALKTMFLKLATKHGAAAAEKVALHVGKQAFAEITEEAVQAVIEEHAASVGLDRGPGWREAARAGVREFYETAGTMGLIALVGTARQGVQARTLKSRQRLADFVKGSLDREAFLLSDNPYAGRGSAEAVEESWISAANRLGTYRAQWEQGGLAALEARADLTQEQASVLDSVFQGEQHGREAEDLILGRNFVAQASAGASRSVYEEATPESVSRIVQEGGAEAAARLERMGFTEAGAARVADYYRQKGARRQQWGRVADDIRAALARDTDADPGRAAQQQAALDSLADLQPLREIYQRAGTTAAAAKEFRALGFTAGQAAGMAEAFKRERDQAVSPGAAAAFRAFYLDTSAEESAGARLKRMTGFEAAPAAEHGEGAARLTLRGADGAVKGSVLYLPGQSEAFDPESPHAGEAVEQRTRGQPFAVTEAEWKTWTPEARAAYAREYNLRAAGGFAVIDEGDPSVSADGRQADILTGRITLDPDAPSVELYHEAAHAWLAVMRRGGKLSAADIAKLQARYGTAANDPAWFNEEAFADDIREIGAETDFRPDKPLARRFIDAVRRFAGAARAEESRRKAAAGARQALFENIIYGAPYEGVADFDPAPTAAGKTEPGKADPLGGAVTAKASDKPAPAADGEGAATPPLKTPAAPSGRKAADDPKKRAHVKWTSETPQGNQTVKGHWVILPRDRFISDTDPRYDMTLQARDRDGTDSSADQIAKIVTKFNATRLLDSPTTDTGAPVVVEIWLKNASGKKTPYYMVVSGNGRFRALDALDADNRGDEYRGPVQAFADERGVAYDPADMTAEARPRLARVMTWRAAGVTRQQIAQLSNQPPLLAMTDAEQAFADAELIERDGTANLYSTNQDGMPSAAGNTKFLKWFIEATGGAAVVDANTNITEAGGMRIRRAMLALAIGHGKHGKETVKVFIESKADKTSKSGGLGLAAQAEGLLLSAGALAKLEEGGHVYGIREELSSAAASIMELAALRKAGKTITTEEHIGQADLFDEFLQTRADLIRLLDSGRPAEGIAAALRRYAELASKIDISTADMFGAIDAKKSELLRKAITDTDVKAPAGPRYSIALAARRYALATGMPAEGEKLIAKQLEFMFARHMDPAYADSRQKAAATRRAKKAADEQAKTETVRAAAARALTHPEDPAAWREAFDLSDGTVSRIVHQFFMRDSLQRFPGEYGGRQLRGLKVQTPADAAALLMPLRNPYQESFKAIFLDAKNRALGAEVCTLGLLDTAPVHAREVFHRGVELGATRVIFAHNHPSGDPYPSKEDRAITDRLAEAGRLLGIEYVDHIITNGESFYSFKGGPERFEGKTAAWEAVPGPAAPKISDETQASDFASVLRQAGGSHIHAVMLDTKNRINAVTRIPFEPGKLSAAGIRAAIFSAAVANPTRSIILDLTADGVSPMEAQALHREAGEAAKIIGVILTDTIYAEGGWAMSARGGRTGVPILPLTAQAAEAPAPRYSLAVAPEQDAAYMAAVEAGDTETAQRMVDEAAKRAGYEVKAFHGTSMSAIPNEFSEDFYRDGRSPIKGFYFSPDQRVAKKYVGRRGENGAMGTFLLRISNPAPVGVVTSIFRDEVTKGKDGFDARMQSRLRAGGYDGVVGKAEVIVFNPSQIKSADPITRDDAGRVIPLSERFNPENDDIRYSLAAGSADPAFTWMRDYYDESWGADAAGAQRDTRERLARETDAVEAAHTHPNGQRKDSWMKAPNGKPTALNARQWLQVRTPAFKAWFGDWERDPANASKILDANGEPLAVYHGTTAAGFAAFEAPRQHTGREIGHYFSRRPLTAATYSGTLKTVDTPGEPEIDGDGRTREMYDGIYPVFLNIRDPKEYDFDGRTWNQYPDADGEGGKATTRELTERAMNAGADGAVFRNVVDFGGFDPLDEAGNLVEDDAVSFGDDVYMALSSFQIKSANANTGTFSRDTDDIRYSVQARRLEPYSLPDYLAEVSAGTSVSALSQTKFKTERGRHKELRDAADWPAAESFARDLAADDRTRLLGNYLLAKYHGDAAAAKTVVERWAKPEEAEKIKARIGDTGLLKPIVATTVSQREGNRFNALPFAYAAWLAGRLGGSVAKIVKVAGAANTGAAMADRVARDYTFAGGENIDSASPMVMVDDVWTSGQTLWTAYEHLKAVNPGAHVAVFATLASGRYGKNARPTQKQLTAFWEKSKLTTVSFKERVGNDIEKLTGSEIQAYILTGGRGPDAAARFFGGRPGRLAGATGGDLAPLGSPDLQSPVRYALDVTGRAYPKEDLLVGFMAHAALTGDAFPSKTTVSRLAEKIGVESFNYEKLSEAARRLSEETTDEAIRKAAASADPEKTAYAVGELARRAARAYVRSGAREGERLGRNADRIRTLSEDGVRRAMQAVTGADYADVETDTEIDIAASILAADPKAFEPRKEREQAEAAGALPETEADPDAQADPDAEAFVETDEEAPGLTDKQRAEIARKRREREARIQALLDAARERGTKNRFRDEERRRKEAEKKAEERETGAAGAAGGGDGASGAAAARQAAAQPAAETAAPVDITDRWEAAALLRVWAFDRFRRDNPLRLGETRDTSKDRVAVEFYRKTATRTLTDLARKLLDPGAPRETVRAMIGDIVPGLTANQIERRTAHVFGALNRHAVREERRSLIKKFRAEIRRQFIKGAKFAELGIDHLNRALTGMVDEQARYLVKICSLSDLSLDGAPSALQAEMNRVDGVLDQRANMTDVDGNPLEVGNDDMESRRALWQKAMLQKYGGMVDMMPGEILDLAGQALANFGQEALAVAQRWEAYDNLVKTIRDNLAPAIARGPDDPAAPDTLLTRTADSLTSMMRQRFDFLTRYEADPAKREAARQAISDMMDLFARGATDYTNAVADDRAALMRAMGEIHAKANGRPDYKRIRAYLRRLDEKIPRELAAQLTRQGHQNDMTYGQMINLLGYLDQWATYGDNIVKHGRKEQAALIRSYRYVDLKTGEVRPVLTNEDTQFLEWLRRRFYADKRGAISEVMIRLAGRPVDSPDPLYMPFFPLRENVQGLHIPSGGAWKAISGVFSRRVRHNLDADESVSVLDAFHNRSHETGVLTAFGERGLIIREVLTSRQFQDAVRRFHGKKALPRILRQAEQALNGGRARGQGQSAAAALAQRLSSYMYIGFNPHSAAKQIVSLSVWANKIGFRNLGKIIFSRIDMDAVRRLRESDEYRARYGTGPAGGMNAADAAAYDAPEASRLKKVFGDWGFWMNRRVDWLPGVWVAQSVYRDLKAKYEDQGMAEPAADRRAISETFSMIEETQQSGRAENLPDLSRDHGFLGRLFAQFATSPLQQLQYEVKEFAEWRDLVNNGGPEANIREARNRFMRALVINHVLVPGLMAAVSGMYKALTGGEPDWRKDGYWWHLVIAGLMGQFGRVFFAGAMAEQTLRVLFLREPPRMGQLVPAEGVIRFTATLAYPIRDIVTWDEENFRADIIRVLKSTALTRLPITVYENLQEKE